MNNIDSNLMEPREWTLWKPSLDKWWRQPLVKCSIHQRHLEAGEHIRVVEAEPVEQECEAHEHSWDTEPVENVTYRPPEHFDKPWVIRMCCAGTCTALRIDKGKGHEIFVPEATLTARENTERPESEQERLAHLRCRCGTAIAVDCPEHGGGI